MENLKKTTVFLVDDDPMFLKVLETQFKEQTQYEIKTFSTGEECLKNLSQKPDIIFLDYDLNTVNPKAHNGLQILDKIKAADPSMQVVMLSAQDRLEVAVNCMKHNAFDYIVKSEAAFMRAQKVITVLFYQKKMEKDLAAYKTMTVIVTTILVLVVIGVVIMSVYFPELMNR